MASSYAYNYLHHLSHLLSPAAPSVPAPLPLPLPSLSTATLPTIATPLPVSTSSGDGMSITRTQSVVEVSYCEGRHICRFRNYSLLSPDAEGVVSSPPFQIGGHTWNILLYPNGCTTADGTVNPGTHMGCFVRIALGDDRSAPGVTCAFEFTIVNQMSDRGRRDHSWSSPSSKVFDRSNTNWGCQSFIHKSILTNDNTGFLLHDTLIIEVSLKIVIGEARRQLVTDIPVPHSSLPSDLTHMLLNGLHGDVRFVVDGEELEVRAHKCILAARSPVFAAMLSNKMAEVSSASRDGITVVHIDDISRPVFEALLRYIYTGECAAIGSAPSILTPSEWQMESKEDRFRHMLHSHSSMSPLSSLSSNSDKDSSSTSDASRSSDDGSDASDGDNDDDDDHDAAIAAVADSIRPSLSLSLSSSSSSSLSSSHGRKRARKSTSPSSASLASSSSSVSVSSSTNGDSPSIASSSSSSSSSAPLTASSSSLSLGGIMGNGNGHGIWPQSLVSPAELLSAANKYLLPRLRIMCERILSQHISRSTAIELLLLADRHQAHELKKRLMEWISSHADIMSHSKWSSLITHRPSLAAECCRVIGHAASPSLSRSKKRNRRSD